MMPELILGGVATVIVAALILAWLWRQTDRLGVGYWATVQTILCTIGIVIMIMLIVGGVIAFVVGVCSVVAVLL